MIGRNLSFAGGLVVFAIFASLAVAGAKASWHIFGESAVLPDEVGAFTSAPPPEPVDLSPIEVLAPFGTRATPEKPETPVEETSLDLVLRGVVLNDAPSRSYAFVSADGRTFGYRPGESIAGRAILLEVQATQILLDVNGERQTLSFPKPGEAVADGGGQTETNGLDRLRARVGAQSDEQEASQPKTTGDYISMWRDRITRNPGEVLSEIGLLATENGYIIDEQHDIGVRLAGLRAGDLVSSVNGQAVGNVEQDRKFFDEVAASGVARLEVVRDGKTMIMSFPLR